VIIDTAETLSLTSQITRHQCSVTSATLGRENGLLSSSGLDNMLILLSLKQLGFLNCSSKARVFSAESPYRQATLKATISGANEV
jgi:hypothetical protein